MSFSDSTPVDAGVSAFARLFFCIMEFFLVAGVSVSETGCSQTETPSSRIHLTLLSNGGSWGEVASAAIAHLRQKRPDIDVEVVTAPGKDYYVKGLAMLAGNSKLDVLWMGEGFGMFASRGALLDLTDLVLHDPDFRLADYDQPVVDWYRSKGRLYGIPLGIDVQAILYNRDIFDEVGLPYPTENWTFDQFVATARQITCYAAQHPGKLKYGAGVDEIRPFYFGLSVIRPDGNAAALDGPLGPEWLKLNVDLLHNEKSFVRVGAEGTLDRLNEFLQGRVAMEEGFDWDIEQLRTNAQCRWSFVVNPLTKQGKRAGWGSSAGFCISAHSKYPHESWLLLKELVSAQAQRQLLKETVPALIALQPEYAKANGTPEENVQALIQMLPYLQPLPRIPESQEISYEWDYWFELALQGQDDPARILREAQDKIDTIIATSPARH